MSFILFLFLAGFWLFMALSDKGASISAQEKYERERRERELPLSRVTDDALYREICNFVSENTTVYYGKKYRTDTIDQTSPAFQERMSDVPEDVRTFSFTRRKATCILMAKQGKLPWFEAKDGFRFYGGNTFTDIGKNIFRYNHTYMTWLDQELQKHGVEPMLFRRDSDGASFPIRQLTEHASGVYYWPFSYDAIKK